MSFQAYYGFHGNTAVLHLTGVLDVEGLADFRATLAALRGRPIRRLLLELRELTHLSAGAVRSLVMAQQYLPADADIVVVGALPPIGELLERAGFTGSATLAEAV